MATITVFVQTAEGVYLELNAWDTDDDSAIDAFHAASLAIREVVPTGGECGGQVDDEPCNCGGNHRGGAE